MWNGSTTDRDKWLVGTSTGVVNSSGESIFADAAFAVQQHGRSTAGSNLKRGGCFVKTPKPLRVGREVRLELKAPGLEEPLGIPGIVTWSSIEASGGGHDTGMTVEYQLDERQRREIEKVLDSLV